MEWEELVKEKRFLDLFRQAPEIKWRRQHPVFKHVLSHRIIFARFYEIEVAGFTDAFSSYLEISESELEKYALPRLITLYLEKSDCQETK